MWDTIIGGLMALIGAWGAMWFQFRNIRENRMNEITAERKVTANAEAYSHVKEIQSYFIQCSLEDTDKLIQGKESWFFSNRLFLPGTFPAKWLSIRKDVHSLIIWETDGSKNEVKLKLHKLIETTIDEAIDEILKDMKQSRIELGENNSKFV